MIHHEAANDRAQSFELTPKLSMEIDRRISHSEMRIKYWIIAGVLANVLIFVVAAIPVVYFLGQIHVQATNVALSLEAANSKITTNDELEARRVLWESSAETWMMQRGWVPPRKLYSGER